MPGGWGMLGLLLLLLAGLILLLTILSSLPILRLPLLSSRLRTPKIPGDQDQDKVVNDRTATLLDWYRWTDCCRNEFPSNSTHFIQLKNHTNDKEKKL